MLEREGRDPAGSGVPVSEERSAEVSQKSPALPRLFSEMAGERVSEGEGEGSAGEGDSGVGARSQRKARAVSDLESTLTCSIRPTGAQSMFWAG